MSPEIPFGDLRREYQALGATLDGAIKRVLESGWFILGSETSAFEEEWARYLGAKHAIGVGNGTDAIRIALEACGVRPGDEVVTTPLTAVPTVTAVCMLGAVPRFADVSPSTGLIDPSALSRVVSRGTRAIVPVHLYGNMCDMPAIMEIARGIGAAVVEDCAQAHGATYGAAKAGTFGLAGCYSFYPSKNLGAYGDGGAVVCDNDEVASRCRMLRNYGQRARYEHLAAGVNSRLDEIQAAILRAKLPYLDQWNARRTAIARCYDAAISGDSVRPLARSDGGVCHLYVLACRDRAGLQAHLAARGIATQVHYPRPVHLQPAFAWLGLSPGSYPVAEELADSVLSLPMHPFLREDEVTRVAEALAEYCQRNR